MLNPATKHCIILTITVVFPLFPFSAQAFDLNDSASIMASTMVTNEQVHPNSAVVGGLGKIGGNVTSVINVFQAYQRISNDKEDAFQVIAGTVVEQYVSYVLQKDLHKMVGPICSIPILGGKMKCLFVTVASATLVEVGSKGYGKATEAAVKETSDAARRFFSRTSLDYEVVWSTDKNAEQKNHRSLENAYYGIQTQKNNCISTNINPELDECFRDNSVGNKEPEEVVGKGMWRFIDMKGVDPNAPNECFAANYDSKAWLKAFIEDDMEEMKESGAQCVITSTNEISSTQGNYQIDCSHVYAGCTNCADYSSPIPKAGSIPAETRYFRYQINVSKIDMNRFSYDRILIGHNNESYSVDRCQ